MVVIQSLLQARVFILENISPLGWGREKYRSVSFAGKNSVVWEEEKIEANVKENGGVKYIKKRNKNMVKKGA
jgi:hypothetical protein